MYMVRVESILDSKVTKEANKYQLKKISFILILFSLIFISIGVLNIANYEKVVGIVLIVIGICYIPLVIGLTKLLQKKIDKTMSVMSSDTKCNYIFTEEDITIDEKKNDEFSCILKAKYSYLYRVVETRDSYLLYISKMQLHAFFKNQIVEGTIEELNDIFKKNLGNEFKSLS